MKIRPKNGVNIRLDATDVIDQWLLMQNMDMIDSELFEQINGSVKYHGVNLGDYEPKALWVNYNEIEDKQDVLVSIHDKIYRKNFGANEYEQLYVGMTPNGIRFPVNLRSKSYIPSRFDGLFEYDGVSQIEKVADIKLRDLIIAKETNRCFGITEDYELVWTDDLVDMGGVPLTWNGLNVDIIPPTEGDVPEKLWLLNGRLVILRTHSIWIYYINGSPSNWRCERLPTVVGCVAPKTVKQVGSELWFLGFSPETKIGVFATTLSSTRLLSYDIKSYLKNVNTDFISESCAEYVDNKYKISIPIWASQVNSHTFHFDTISINKDTGSPNIYGPHTYGFNCSTVLNTRRFKGEHLFGRKASDGGRIYKVDTDYKTQYSNELLDDGELIQTILLSGVIDKEETKNEVIDGSWIKKYGNIYLEHPPIGSGSCHVEIFKGCENEASLAYDQYLEGNASPLEAIYADEAGIDFTSIGIDGHISDFTSDAIQIKATNSNPKNKMIFKSLNYDVAPYRRKKYVQTVSI